MTMTGDRDVAEALLREAKHHLLEESLPRLRKAVSLLSEDQLWHRVNTQTNSVGNLLLHLNGNVRQWIVSGLGGTEDDRVRSGEFETRSGRSGASLLASLEETLAEAAKVLEGLEPGNLLEKKTIQGEEVTGLQAIVHVVEHFSYHTGQVAHMVKAMENVDLGYYQNRDLNQRNRV